VRISPDRFCESDADILRQCSRFGRLAHFHAEREEGAPASGPFPLPFVWA
jgi:hypothetical protein